MSKLPLSRREFACGYPLNRVQSPDPRKMRHPLHNFVFVSAGAIGLCAIALLPGCRAKDPSVLRQRDVRAEHVVLVVWDGMRPEFVSAANSPTLWKLAHDGVTFRNHHSIYPSLTNVNSTALATGVFPARSGLLANYEYRPELERVKTIRSDDPIMVRKGDELSLGHYLTAPTIAELVQAAGGSTAIVGGKTTSLLHDRTARGHESVTIFSGATLPESAAASIVKLLGAFPDMGHSPGAAGDDWTTRALLESLWAAEIPRYTVLWLSEPDRAQHEATPGSKAALNGIKSSDAHLHQVLHALEQKGVRDKTDIIVASDHGFSTIQRTVDLPGSLRAAGFAVLAEGDEPGARGSIRMVGNGGTVLFYITEHDDEIARRLVAWLQQGDFAGVIFSRGQIEGTFTLSQAHIDTVAAPDLVMSFRWNEERNESGVPGMMAAITTLDPIAGTHGTLSKFDLHNTLIAAGPDFLRGSADELPTSNLDVAATVLHLLGITPPQSLDGRIFYEALSDYQGHTTAGESSTIEATRIFPSGLWRQYLRTTKVGEQVYLDEGNGELRLN